MTTTAAQTAQITQVWRYESGGVSAVTMAAEDGARFTVQLRQRDGRAVWVLSWASHPSDRGGDVWAHPEPYGFERWYCPGHNGGACQYGACDEIRYTLPVDIEAQS